MRSACRSTRRRGCPICRSNCRSGVLRRSRHSTRKCMSVPPAYPNGSTPRFSAAPLQPACAQRPRVATVRRPPAGRAGSASVPVRWVRTRASSSSRWNGLAMKSTAPSARPCTRPFTSRAALRNMTGISWVSTPVFSLRHTSNPSMPGIRMSKRTRFGRQSWTDCSASSRCRRSSPDSPPPSERLSAIAGIPDARRARTIYYGYGALAGGTRRLVACSKAYPNSINRGSLQAMPVKLTPKGLGFALNPGGKASFGALSAIPNGTITVG
jgi:hypothetical protein